jgi:hypothetical protein
MKSLSDGGYPLLRAFTFSSLDLSTPFSEEAAESGDIPIAPDADRATGQIRMRLARRRPEDVAAEERLEFREGDVLLDRRTLRFTDNWRGVGRCSDLHAELEDNHVLVAG